MRAVIAEMSDAVRRGISASNVEELCRFVVAQVMEDEDRLLFDEEIFDIVEPTVADETVANPDDMIDGDQAFLTEVEWDKLDDIDKAVDKDGERYVISGGRLYETRIIEDTESPRIASAISSEIEAALNAKSIADGCRYDIASFRMEAEEVVRRCPCCGSVNTDAVWYDKKMVVSHCHDCTAEFEEQVDAETATTEELTTDEYKLEDGNFAYIYYEDGWYLSIEEPDGTCIYNEPKSDPDEALNYINMYNSDEFDIEPGEVLKSVESGKELKISAVTGNIAEVNGVKVSRANLKISKMLGKLVSDKSAVRDLVARAGDEYINDSGDRLTIESIEDGDIIYNEVAINEQSGLTQDITARCGKSEFMDVLENGGYAY